MKPILPFALALLAATAPAQFKAQSPAVFTDPANLRGERVSPRTGRELPVDQGSLGLAQLLRKLNTRASIMNIVAHPDDEDGGMMAYYSRGLGARVADMSLTRGEGGQNAMTADFEDALGLLRTQELLSSDRYPSVDQFFGTEVDFGFSKTKEEAFAKWTHDRVLYDVVRAIRLYRPLVLTSTWIGGVTDGHGQHQVSGQIAQEAFVAAGDPKVFPELTAEGILPWQPLRIYARVPMQSISPRGLYDYATGQYTPAKFTNYVTGEVTTTPPSTDVVIHEGTPDPLLADDSGKPRSYVQFARIGLALQKSQVTPGMMRGANGGSFDVSYHLFGDRTCAPAKSCHPEQREGSAVKTAAAQMSAGAPNLDPGFFAGIDTSITGIADLAPGNRNALAPLKEIAAVIQQATTEFDPKSPEKIAPILANALKQTDSLIEYVTATSQPFPTREDVLHELRIKRVQLNNALALALGVNVDATTEEAGILANSTPEVQLSSTQIPDQKHARLTLHSQKEIMEANIRFLEGNDPHHANPIQLPIKLSKEMTSVVTKPYFSRNNIEQPFYNLSDPSLRDAPSTPPPFTAWTHYDYNGTTFDLGRVLHAQDQMVSVVPSASLAVSTYAQVLPNSDDNISLTLYESTSDSPTATIHDGAPADWQLLPTDAAANCDGCDPLLYRVPRADRQAVTLHPSMELKDGTVITEGFHSIGYGDLQRTNQFTPATDRIVPVDIKFPSSVHRFPVDPTGHYRIGYLPGTGDSVPQALNSIGIYTRILKVSDLTKQTLAELDTVILGVRAYAAHPDLHGAPTQALLDFARNGGNVVLQYETHEFTAADAPYPFTMEGQGEKVVDETAPVALLTPGTSRYPETSGSGMNRYPEASASGFTANAKEGALAPGYALLNQPNKLTPADFDGWVEERGHGFLQTWDDHYTALTETHDPGQDPQKGGLITTPLGKGRWTYIAFALYRQLPEAVPGAYRLFVNLLEP